MTKEEIAIAYFESMKKVLCEDYLKACPKNSIGYNATLMESECYEELWNRLYDWLNDMRFSIAPDETVTDDKERKVRSIQVDLLDEIMEWMVDQVPKADGGGE